MENYKDIVNKINLIIEQSDVDNPKCKNCISYVGDIHSCTFGREHRKNMNKYLFAREKITSPDYSCENFKPIYGFGENTVDVLRDMVRDIEKVNEDIMNLELMLDGKIDENEFVELVK